MRVALYGQHMEFLRHHITLGKTVPMVLFAGKEIFVQYGTASMKLLGKRQRFVVELVAAPFVDDEGVIEPVPLEGMEWFI